MLFGVNSCPTSPQVRCHLCFASCVYDACYSCGSCNKACYCSRRCALQDATAHLDGGECQSLSSLDKLAMAEGESTTTLRLLLRIAACLAAEKKGPSTSCGKGQEEDATMTFMSDSVVMSCGNCRFSQITTLESHAKDAPVPVRDAVKQVARALVTILPPDSGLSRRHLTSLFFTVQCNAHAIHDNDKIVLGLGLFPLASMVNHSCIPNCHHAFRLMGDGAPSPQPPRLVFRATRTVTTGAELAYSYIDLYQPTSVRRMLLERAYFFRCMCQRCEEVDALSFAMLASDGGRGTAVKSTASSCNAALFDGDTPLCTGGVPACEGLGSVPQSQQCSYSEDVEDREAQGLTHAEMTAGLLGGQALLDHPMQNTEDVKATMNQSVNVTCAAADLAIDGLRCLSGDCKGAVVVLGGDGGASKGFQSFRGEDNAGNEKSVVDERTCTARCSLCWKEEEGGYVVAKARLMSCSEVAEQNIRVAAAVLSKRPFPSPEALELGYRTLEGVLEQSGGKGWLHPRHRLLLQAHQLMASVCKGLLPSDRECGGDSESRVGRGKNRGNNICSLRVVCLLRKRAKHLCLALSCIEGICGSAATPEIAALYQDLSQSLSWLIAARNECNLNNQNEGEVKVGAEDCEPAIEEQELLDSRKNLLGPGVSAQDEQEAAKASLHHALRIREMCFGKQNQLS
ncbi:unnamed protein product [Choristocarpus tenellus]